MSRVWSVTFAAVLFALLAMPARTQSPAPPARSNPIYSELGRAPKRAAARRNPLASEPDAVAAGGKLFDRHCAQCHGQMAEGTSKAPSLLADEVQSATPGTLFWLLSNGVIRRGMPDWSKLPEPQRWQLVSYIQSFSPTPSNAPGAEKASSHP